MMNKFICANSWLFFTALLLSVMLNIVDDKISIHLDSNKTTIMREYIKGYMDNYMDADSEHGVSSLYIDTNHTPPKYCEYCYGYINRSNND